MHVYKKEKKEKIKASELKTKSKLKHQKDLSNFKNINTL